MPTNKTITQIVDEVLKALQQARAGSQNVPAEALEMRGVLVSPRMIDNPNTIPPEGKRYYARWRVEPPASIVIDAGNNQRGVAGRAIPIDPQIHVEDDQGNPIEGAWVRFAVTQGGGTIEVDKGRTDAQGLTIKTWVLGEVGTNKLTVTVRSPRGLLTVEIVAQAVAGGTRSSTGSPTGSAGTANLAGTVTTGT